MSCNFLTDITESKTILSIFKVFSIGSKFYFEPIELLLYARNIDVKTIKFKDLTNYQ